MRPNLNLQFIYINKYFTFTFYLRLRIIYIYTFFTFTNILHLQ